MKAAAAVLIAQWNDSIILTKRAANLRSFRGHICLPGGQAESLDNSPVATALREFQEEVYFSGDLTPQLCMLAEVSVVGKMAVFPIVAKLSGELTGFNRQEVAKLIHLPLAKLTPDFFQLNPFFPRISHNKCFDYAGHWIWGLTAEILYQFSCKIKPYL